MTVGARATNPNSPFITERRSPKTNSQNLTNRYGSTPGESICTWLASGSKVGGGRRFCDYRWADNSRWTIEASSS